MFFMTICWRAQESPEPEWFRIGDLLLDGTVAENGFRFYYAE